MWKFFLILISIYIVGAVSALYVNNKNVKKGLKGIPWKDCFNPVKWMSVLYGFFLKVFIPPHVFEQLILRVYDPECQPCVENGKCVHCGCDTIAKMYSPLERDSDNNWDTIIWNKRKYKQHREKFPVKILVEW